MKPALLDVEATTYTEQRPIDTALVVPDGPLRRLYRWVQPAVEGAFGLSALWRTYDHVRAESTDSETFAKNALASVGVTYAVSDADVEALRSVQGPLVICANHPFGGTEFFALALLLERIRPGGWKFMGNRIVCSIHEFSDRMIPVEPLGVDAEAERLNRRALVQAARYLETGGIVGLFPAARVSHWRRDLGAVCDRPWSDHALRLAARHDATLACFHIPGRNSRRFLTVPRNWIQLRSLMLTRELLHPHCRTVDLRLASLYAPRDLQRMIRKAKHPAARLRAACYWRADRDAVVRGAETQAAAPRADSLPAIAEPVARDVLEPEIERLQNTHRVAQHHDFDLLLVRGEESPILLEELGRRREITFRAAGQGVGRPSDLAPEDQYYHHLILWDRAKELIAGAYRIGMVQPIIAERGVAGLYLDHIFKIRPEFYEKLGPAFELSRSFVMPDYQRDNRALAGLWKGLAAASVRHESTTLFGSVTISNDHHPASRALLVEHLRRNYADDEALSRLVRARRPFQASTRYHTIIADAFAGEPIDTLQPLIEQMEDGQRGIPPLMRYYCALNARYMAYHVEPSFQDALYCLLRVDLNKIPKAYKRRFMG